MGRALVVMLAFAVPLVAQQPPAFHADTRLVVLHATVRNARGELVTTLGRDAFAVFENGTRQPIAVFRREDVPVSIGILLDSSRSMRENQGAAHAAARALVRASNPEDEAFVVSFADTARVDVPFTNVTRLLEAGIAGTAAVGGTAMWDAFDVAQEYLRVHARRDRKVLVVVTDGFDNASSTPMQRVIERAQRDGDVVWAIGLLDDAQSGKASRARREIDRITAATGGGAYYPDRLEAAEASALEVASQIRSQYTIAYTPLNQALDGTYRRIRVSVVDHRGLAVRTRDGYRATPVSTSGTASR